MCVEAVLIKDKLSQVDQTWTSKLIAKFNNHEVKVLKLRGVFVWHSHESTDELFWVISGILKIDIKGCDAVVT